MLQNKLACEVNFQREREETSCVLWERPLNVLIYPRATASISALPDIPGGLVPSCPRFYIQILVRLKDDGLSEWTLGARTGMRGLVVGETCKTHHTRQRGSHF